MGLQVLQYSPDSFWIGPVLSFVCRQTFVTTGVCWGWDKDDPVSVRPQVRMDRVGDGRVRVVSWFGFNLNVATLSLSDPFRMEAANVLLSKMRLIEWGNR